MSLYNIILEKIYYYYIYMQSEQQVFWISIVTIGVGMIITCMKYGYKSKCSEVNIGCISIKRDVVVETKYDLEHPLSDEDVEKK
jgi:hypothetical protein